MRRTENPDIRDRYPGSPLNMAGCPSGEGILCKRMVHKFESCTGLLIFLWCNGSTFDFGSKDRGSNPCRKTWMFQKQPGLLCPLTSQVIAGRGRCDFKDISLFYFSSNHQYAASQYYHDRRNRWQRSSYHKVYTIS